MQKEFGINERLPFAQIIMRACHDPFMVIDKNGKIVNANAATETITGMPVSELVDTNFHDYFTEPDKAKSIHNEVKETGSVNGYQLAIRHKNDSFTRVSCNGTMYRDEVHNESWVFLIAKDLTGEKQTHQFYRSILESNADPMVILDSTGMLLDVNAAFCNITGVTRDELLQTPFQSYYTDTVRARQVYINLFLKESVTEVPLVLKNRKGKHYEVLLTGSLHRNIHGASTGLFSVKKNPVALRLSGRSAESIMESSFDPVILIDTKGKITDINSAFVSITPISPEKLIGSHFAEYFIEFEKAINVFQEVFKKGAIVNYPLTFKDGANTDVIINGTIIKNEEGEPSGAIMIIRDRLLQNRATRYARSLIEASKDVIITISLEGKITDVNKATIDATNTSRGKLIGSDFFNYFTDREAAMDLYKEVFGNGHITNYPLTIKDGNYSDVIFNGSVFKDVNRKVIGAVLIARDIVDRKQSEQYVRSLIEASLDPLIAINTEGKITDVNKATVKVTGASREKLIGSDFYNYFTEPSKAREAYRQIFEKGYITDYPLTIMNDKLTDVLFNGAVYKNDRNEVLGVVVVARDITLLKKNEKALVRANSKAEKARKMAEEAMRAKQQFLSNMSHEIRTPMNSIIGFTKVLLKTDLSVKQKEYLSAIKLSGDTLIVLINDILDLAKVDAGKMTYEQVPFRLTESIDAMMRLFETKVQEKNIKLIKDFDATIPKVLMGDPVRLRQVILNLISNAVKFTDKGNITMQLNLIKDYKDSVTVRFAVTDTGIGIPENKIKNIFEKFQQANTETARLYGGTGLGLAIVKQLVEGQHGTVFIKSELNKGSTFGFTLSFKKTTVDVRSEEEVQIKKADKSNKEVKVLVVEDNNLNQLLMRTILNDFGFKQDIAANGKIAVDKMKKNDYDIVLLDLQMPVMNGFEVAEYVRGKMRSNIPIIALTADVTDVDVKKCREIGMDDYVSKPVDEKLLYAKMLDLLGKNTDTNRNIFYTRNT